MIEIECLACYGTLELPQYIDVDNYDGQLVCKKCKALLYVQFKKGKLRKYRNIEKKSKPNGYEALLKVAIEEAEKDSKKMNEH